MSFRCMIDTYAWLAYFKGERGADMVERMLEKGDCATPMIVIAELADKFAQTGIEKQQKLAFDFIASKTAIIEMDIETAIKAGKTKNILRKKTGQNVSLADAIIYELAMAHNSPVLTGDPHFRGLENVIFI